MVQKITISNFYSIREPLEVSFEASKEKQYGEDWIIEKGNIRLLKALLLYGANGSGKTNILCALEFLKHLAIYSPVDIDDPFGHRAFALDKESQQKETSFDLYFFIDDTRYRYFVSIDHGKFLSEELRVFTSGNNSKSVFSRKFNEAKGRSSVRFGTWLDLSATDRKAIEENTTRNSSVLGAYSRKNISCSELTKVRNYFKYDFFKICSTEGSDSEVARLIKDDPALKILLIELLRTFHSNIVDIRVEEHVEVIPEATRNILMHLRPIEERETISNMKSLTTLTGTYIHRTALGEFALEDKLQSEGTRSFIRHIVLFYATMKRGKLLAMDEFGAGMQAKTQNLLLDFFLKFSRNSQLIVATQSLGFLDYLCMRRDAIDIVSKDELGQTHLDNKTVRGIHKNIKLRKAYIDGKFTSIDPNEPDLDLAVEKFKYMTLIFGKQGKEGSEYEIK